MSALQQLILAMRKDRNLAAEILFSDNSTGLAQDKGFELSRFESRLLAEAADKVLAYAGDQFRVMLFKTMKDELRNSDIYDPESSPNGSGW